MACVKEEKGQRAFNFDVEGLKMNCKARMDSKLAGEGSVCVIWAEEVIWALLIEERWGGLSWSEVGEVR